MPSATNQLRDVRDFWRPVLITSVGAHIPKLARQWKPCLKMFSQ